VEFVLVKAGYWSRFIVLKSSEGCIPLTKLSPFVIEKYIKSCAGDVTKLKSGGLMIEVPTRAILEFRGSPSESIRNSKDGILEQ
jgi:hypothetical protein